MTDSARQAAAEQARALRIRLIAWPVLIVTGGTSGTMSVYHACKYGDLPWELAVLTGAVPVIVAMGMSEIVALYDAGRLLKGLTFAVMAGGLAMTMHASAIVVGPAQGAGFRWGWGLDLDLAALIALFVLLNPQPRRAAKAAAAPRKPAAERTTAAVARAVERYEPSVPPPLARGPAAAGHGPAGATGSFEPAHEPPAALAHPGEMGHPPAHEPPADEPAARRPAKTPEPQPLARDAEAESARKAYRDSVANGEPLSKRKLAEQFGRSPNWAQYRIDEVKNGPHLARAQ